MKVQHASQLTDLDKQSRPLKKVLTKAEFDMALWLREPRQI
jgi:hypothetical protein